MKRCANCEEEKPTTEFWRYYRTSDGLQSWCKSCSQERVRKWWADNPERKKEIDGRARRIYRAREKRRMVAR